MRKAAAIAAAVLIACGLGFGQSNGNFSAAGSGAACVINNSTGALSGGVPIGGNFSANISTNSAKGTTLLIRPSLVTGLFTDTKISTSIPTASADVGIQVCVTVDGSSAGVLPAPCVIYDQRFQELSSQLFSQLTECTTTTACNLTATPAVLCPVNFTCSATSGPGVCLNNLCNLELILSTLSAHSFDFVVQPGFGKPHTVQATWNLVPGTSNTSGGSTMACAGPGVLTVTQTQVFNNSGSLSFN
jgi:hypothetical protein